MALSPRTETYSVHTSQDRLRIFSLRTSELLATAQVASFQGMAPLRSLAISDDGTSLAAGYFGEVLLYEKAASKPRRITLDAGGYPDALAFAVHSRALAIADSNGRVLIRPQEEKVRKLFEVPPSRLAGRFAGLARRIVKLAFFDSDRGIALQTNTGDVLAWSIQPRTLIYDSGVTSCRAAHFLAHPTGDELFMLCEKSVRVFSSKKRSEIAKLSFSRQIKEPTNLFTLDSAFTRLAIVDAEGDVFEMDRRTGAARKTRSTLEPPLKAVGYSVRSGLLLTYDGDIVQVLTKEGDRYGAAFCNPGSCAAVQLVRFLKGGRMLAADESGSIGIYRIHDGTHVKSFRLDDATRDYAVSSEGGAISFLSIRRNAYGVLDLLAGKTLWKRHHPSLIIDRISIAKNGDHLAGSVVTPEQGIYLLPRSAGHPSRVLAGEFAALASCGADEWVALRRDGASCRVQVWSGRRTCTSPLRLEGAVCKVACRGETVCAQTSAGRLIIVTRSSTGHVGSMTVPAVSGTAYRGHVTAVDIRSGNSYVGLSSGVVVRWNATIGTTIALHNDRSPVTVIRASQDGEHLLVGYADGSSVVWRVGRDEK